MAHFVALIMGESSPISSQLGWLVITPLHRHCFYIFVYLFVNVTFKGTSGYRHCNVLAPW